MVSAQAAVSCYFSPAHLHSSRCSSQCSGTSHRPAVLSEAFAREDMTERTSSLSRLKVSIFSASGKLSQRSSLTSLFGMNSPETMPISQ